MMSTRKNGKSPKYKVILSFVGAALTASYIMFICDSKFAGLLLGACPVLGIWAAWLIIKIGGFDNHQYFKKYELSPALAATALGAPLAGLPIAILIIQSIPPPGFFDFSLLGYIAAIFGAGQVFWLLWLTVGLRYFWFGRAPLLKVVRALEGVVIFVGVLSIVPLVNYWVIFGAWFAIGSVLH